MDLTLSTQVCQPWSMARELRIRYPGTIYHLTNAAAAGRCQNNSKD